MRLIDYFDAYAKAGLRVIPLFPKSKVPMWDGWNLNWEEDRCRQACVKYPFANLGLLLGEIVDVEGDTEDANKSLAQMIGDCPHPIYRSSKSDHHLFMNPDPDLTARRFSDIEFRAYKHQSVIPPSRHEDGTQYQWLAKTKFPIPPMPGTLLEYYQRNIANLHRPNIKPGHLRPWCSACRQKKYIHKKRYHLEVEAFKTLGLNWECRICRSVDIRELCRELRAKHG